MEEAVSKTDTSLETQETSIIGQEETTLSKITNQSRTECNSAEVIFIVKFTLQYIFKLLYSLTFRSHIRAEDTDRERSQRADDACVWTTRSANERNRRSTQKGSRFTTAESEGQKITDGKSFLWLFPLKQPVCWFPLQHSYKIRSFKRLFYWQ